MTLYLERVRVAYLWFKTGEPKAVIAFRKVIYLRKDANEKTFANGAVLQSANLNGVIQKDLRLGRNKNTKLLSGSDNFSIPV